MNTITKTLTNSEIYEVAVNLNNNFANNGTYFPALAAFAIQKNRDTLTALAQELENSRLQVAKHYGEEQTPGSYIIAPENMLKANEELNELLDASQDVKIYTINIESLKDARLTSQEMSSILFMIEEE